VAFGELSVDGERYYSDVVIEAGRVRKRDKGPSKALRGRYGHTPLSTAEEIPWGGSRLIVGTGAYGSLPILPEVYDEATRRGIEVTAVPTSEACRLVAGSKRKQVFAVLHATC
jgi:hypothetical protein